MVSDRLLGLRAEGIDAGHNLESGSEFHGQRHDQVFRLDEEQRLTVHLLHEELIRIARAPGYATDEVADFAHLDLRKIFGIIE